MSNQPPSSFDDDQFAFDDEIAPDSTRRSGPTRPQMARPPTPKRETGPLTPHVQRPAQLPEDDAEVLPPLPRYRSPSQPDETDWQAEAPLGPPSRSAPTRSASRTAPTPISAPASTPANPAGPRAPRTPQRSALPEPSIPPRRKPLSPPKRESGLYLPWWSLVIMVAFVAAAAFGAWAIVFYLTGNAVAGGNQPIVIVVTSTFTVGPPATPTALAINVTPVATSQLPTFVPTGTKPPGDFALNATIKVVGVGEAGLNVRSTPGTDGAVKFRGQEDEQFILKEAPQTANGIEWWFIQSASDPNRSGWAARQYLEVVSAP